MYQRVSSAAVEIFLAKILQMLESPSMPVLSEL